MVQAKDLRQMSFKPHEDLCRRAVELAMQKGISIRAALVEITEDAKASSGDSKKSNSSA